MRFMFVIERPWKWKPGRYKSDVVTRVWWGLLAIKRIKVSEHEYATRAYAWEES